MAMDHFETHEAITEYVKRGAYEQDSAWALYRSGWRSGGTPKLPLAIAEPDALIEDAIRISGPGGMTDAALRRVVPVTQKRFERGLWRLRTAGLVTRTKERRPDRRMAMRDQIIWRHRAEGLGEESRG